MKLETVKPRWSGLCVVAATGPSLTKEVAEACIARRVLAIKDAWRRMPWAEVLYGCDQWWWEHYKGCPDFRGERWSSHDEKSNPKLDVAEKYGLSLIRGQRAPGFSTDPSVIHYGCNSGFQGINLAILLGATKIVLVGFDMQGSHFFGDHPNRRSRAPYGHFLPHFEVAAKRMPEGVEIVNATPGSALKCFPMVRLEDVL